MTLLHGHHVPYCVLIKAIHVKQLQATRVLGTGLQGLHVHYEMVVFNHKMAFLYPAELHVCSGLPPQEAAVVIAERHILLSFPAACHLHGFCQQAYTKKSCCCLSLPAT